MKNLGFDVPKPVVAVLSTYNRYDLLGQALPMIKRECLDVGIPLIISDDHSTDRRTLDLIEIAEADGATITRREKPRSENPRLHPAVTIGLNWVHIVRFVEQNCPPDTVILKLDDDIALIEGAFRRMLYAWNRVMRAHNSWDNFLALSGITTVNEKIVTDNTGRGDVPYIEVSGPASPCVLHRLDLWKAILDEDEVSPVKHGFDTYFVHTFAKTRPNGKMWATRPSVAYHCAHTGVHLLNTDVNRKPPDPLAWPGDVSKLLVHKGGETRWMTQYGHRRELPR